MNEKFLDEIRALPQWVAWRLEWIEKDKRFTKRPMNARTGQYASSSNAETWTTYDAALNWATEATRAKGVKFGDYYGVGFMFGDPGGYAGLDLDHVILEDGTLKPFAAEIVKRMDSYTELSPSGQGLHILFKLKVPLSEIYSGNKNKELGLEIYDNRRYFTITGQVYGDGKPIAERTDAAREVCAKYFIKEAVKVSTERREYSPPVENWKYQPRDLWQVMFNAENGRKIQALYNGDISMYDDDHSAADLAMCNALAFYTRKEAAEMDRMFRETALFRPDKWDKVHYSTGETYGERTIATAIADTYSVYEPYALQQERRAQPPMNGKIQYAANENAQELPQAENLLSYFESKFEADIERFSQFKNRKTGFSNIDEFTSLYPGLYAVGAVSSAGKTTFTHQIADQLARAGDYVLYFSLEQTRLELATKGLARLAAQEDMICAVSSIDIRRGRITDSVRRAIGEYKTFAERETVIECGFDTTIGTITAYVESYIAATGKKPVVFVDYLQIIRPSDSRRNMKDVVDEHVHALKKLQADNDLVIFVISSFNRKNYLATADFEAFKESGGIEYTADVVWALQLQAMNAAIFSKDEKIQEKRKFVQAAKNATPRKIELVCLKNRYGRSNARYFFEYYAEYDLFIPQAITESDADEYMSEDFEKFVKNSGGNKTPKRL